MPGTSGPERSRASTIQQSTKSDAILEEGPQECCGAMSDDEDAMEMVSFDHLISESVERDKDSTGKHSNLENPSDMAN